MNIEIWKGYDRINWLCMFMQEFANLQDLSLAPLLLSGYKSIHTFGPLQDKENALYNIRWIALHFSTKSTIRRAVIRYNEYYRSQVETGGSDRRLFSINENTLVFSPINDILPPEYDEAKNNLAVIKSIPTHDWKYPDQERNIYVEFSESGIKNTYQIKNLPKLNEIPNYLFSNAKQEEIHIQFAGLLQEAIEMDAIDKKLQRKNGNWALRLKNVLLEVPKDDGSFLETNILTLSGLKHLIGLPGAGKTTLLMCLVRYLFRHGYKTAVFFPSIDVCRQYLSALEDYEVNAALLMGQSGMTRTNHSHQISETIASGDQLHGFGKSIAGASYFSTNCVLPTYTSAAEDEIIPTGTYCYQILEKFTNTKGKVSYIKRLCPLWSKCGYQKAARGLSNALVWLGHIASCDTQLPYHSTELRVSYFEILSRDFDVVIFDEADMVQSWLDEQGVSKLTLTGDSHSFHADLQKRQSQMTMEKNFNLGDPSFFAFSMNAIDFSRHSHLLINAIQNLDSENRDLYEGIFLTPARFISSLVAGDKRKSGLAPELEDIDTDFRRKDSISELWAYSTIKTFYNRQNKSDAQIGKSINFSHIAENLGLQEENVRKMDRLLQEHLRDWLTGESKTILDGCVMEILEILRPLIKSQDENALKQKIRLLISVTFTILSYRRLAPHSDALIEQGFLMPSNVEKRCSDDFLKATTENMLGNLSGVRFSLEQESSTNHLNTHVKLQYVVFSGSPRSFIYNLHNPIPGSKKAPAVLLASATSFLEQSPAYHIEKTPDYIVRARESYRRRFEKSEFSFIPIQNPLKPEMFLQYSGEHFSVSRENNLKKMVQHLLKGGLDDSIVGEAIRTFDSEARQRKAVFVVNSYKHCEIIKQYIDSQFPDWSTHSVAVVKDVDKNNNGNGYITSAQVESLGDLDHIKLIVFPMGAIGRGTNIVFTKGERRLDAAIGNMYFLTRPHPSSDDLSLLISLAAQASEKFSQEQFFNATSIKDVSNEYVRHRQRLYGTVGSLLRNPLRASRLGPLLEPFTANSAITLLQTIGRGMRNGCPVRCIFVDVAWARQSAKNGKDTPITSMLVQLIDILEKCLQHDDPKKAAIYRELYEPFLVPLRKTYGLKIKNKDETISLPNDESLSSGFLVEDFEYGI